MTPQRRVQLLMGATFAGVLAAVALLLRAPDVAVTPRAVALPAVSATVAEGVSVDSSRIDEVLNGNVFSPQRRRPVQRTLLAAAEPTLDTTASMQAMAGDVAGVPSVPADSSSARVEDGVPRLYGVVVNDGVTGALLRLDRSRPGAALYREGDRAGGFVVRRIEVDRVALDGPRGALWLRLAPRRNVP